MIKLSECSKGDIVKVVKLEATKELKQRLISFGIMKESIIEVLAQAPANSALEIKVGKMTIALRGEEANMIKVQRV